MPVEGVDYSWGRPDPECLYRNGKRFAVRYVSFNTTGKNITLSEAQRLNAAGLSIVTNWEWDAHDQLGGLPAGEGHAAAADELHRRAGGPADRPIYFSTDFDANPSQLTVAYDYLRGAAREIGWSRVGVYGGVRTIRFMADKGVRWLWQTYAWSGGVWDRRANIRQYRNGVQLCGGDTDLNRAMTDDYGQWTIGGSVPIDRDDVKKLLNEDNIINAPTLEATGEDRSADAIKANPYWTLEAIIRAMYNNIARTREDIRDKPPADPVALAEALANSPDAVNAIATAVAGRLGMIPTAGEIGKSVVDQLRDRL